MRRIVALTGLVGAATALPDQATASEAEEALRGIPPAVTVSSDASDLRLDRITGVTESSQETPVIRRDENGFPLDNPIKNPNPAFEPKKDFGAGLPE